MLNRVAPRSTRITPLDEAARCHAGDRQIPSSHPVPTRRHRVTQRAALGVVVLSCLVFGNAHPAEPTRALRLPTSRTLTLPVPGFVGRTNGYPATIAVSPDGRHAALLNQGFGTEETGVRQSIAILDLGVNEVHDFPDDRFGDRQKYSYFIGLAFSTDGTHLYASMSSLSDSKIAIYKFQDGRVTPDREIAIPPQRLAPGKELIIDAGERPAGTAPTYPAGLTVVPSASGDRLLIANNLSDSVSLLDVESGQILKSFDVSVSQYVPSALPYTVIANREGTKAWASLWNDSAVAELDLVRGTVVRRIALWRPSGRLMPGTHPTAMALSRDESRLYVALANAGVGAADGIAEIDPRRGVVRRILHTTLTDRDGAGTQALAIALSSDETRLYAASASLDAVAVFRLERAGAKSSARPIGFIPTEWYPSALAVAGTDLLIATAKGESTGPNNMQPKKGNPALTPDGHPYIASLLGGSLQRLPLSDIETNLKAYTRQVESDNLLHRAGEKLTFEGGRNPIRHVIYILKENRSYDQLFGDLGYGDGDASLTMYGADITPNQHALARQFGVIDNFYDSGDVSANGHLWSDGSATNDYIEKVWPQIYRHSEYPDGFLGNPLDQDLPDVSEPGTGFLWDNLTRHHLSFRIYGEMLDVNWCRDPPPPHRDARPPRYPKSGHSEECPTPEIRPGEPLPDNVGSPPGGPSPWPWPVPRLRTIRPAKAAQRGHFDLLFPDFDIEYPDQLRADEFMREFAGFVKARGTSAGLPQFVLIYFPNDHTGGTRPGKATPRASVADNDLAVGRVVEAVSNSPYWDDTAIFVVEDDAQAGADHVDAHRSIALVVSKYAPAADKPIVFHDFYTTSGLVHTVEALLGLPPMNLFDSRAPLLAPLFTGTGVQPPYRADDTNLRNGLLYQVNAPTAPGAKESLQMDFSQPDKVDTQRLNAILWQDAHMPRAAAADGP